MAKKWKIIGAVIIFLVILVGLGTYKYYSTLEKEITGLKSAASVIDLSSDWKLVDERYTPKYLFCGDITCPSAFQRWRSSQPLEGALTHITKVLDKPSLDDCDDLQNSHSFCTVRSFMNGYTYQVSLRHNQSSNSNEVTLSIERR